MKHDITHIINLYNSGMSTGLIAEKTHIPKSTVQRILKNAGIKMRTRSEAQTLAIKTGRSEHPTKDKELTEETKSKIGRSVAETYEGSDEQKKIERSTRAKEIWEKKSDSEIRALQKAATAGIQRASREGSSMERFLREELTREGISHVAHQKAMFGANQLEVDILIPQYRVVVEFDGPSHFVPLYGDKTLHKTQGFDAKKNGLLIGAGYVVIRIQYKEQGKKLSKTKLIDVFGRLLNELKEISEEFPPVGKRLIKIEV